MSDTPDMTDIFQFMEVRAPFSPDTRSLRQNYIRDDFVGLRDSKPNRIETDLQSATSPSAIGRLVYERVFCSDDANDLGNSLDALTDEVLGLLVPYEASCPTPTVPAPHSTNGLRALSITELERRAHINEGDLYYLLPERMEQIEGLMLFPELLRALELMEEAQRSFDPSRLTKQLETIFNAQPLRRVVFDQGVYAERFKATKRTLFDTLYLLYILRRRTSVNLEHVIDGLRVLHVLEALSIDSLIRSIKPSPPLPPPDASLRKTLEVLFPELLGWNGSDPLPTLPIIQTQADFEACLGATPVIHPIFARLHRYRLPFNDLKPIGIGDLKVVKQWLIAYLPGEISHIENVLRGEATDRTHRRLEKTDESFSFSIGSREWSQKDMQGTERLELKREIDNVVKSELSAGATANLTYNSPGGTIISNVGANFGYKRDATQQSKASETFGRETVAKAIEQVEKNVTETRVVTKVFETEETNKHTFDNKEGQRHVTGIYRWLDKKYKAQLFNFGKRMMFEFMVPEPAAFFAEARLRAFEATLDCPQPPQAPVPKTVSLAFSPADIDQARFQELRQKYDLSEFTFPQTTRWVEFINSSTDQNLFSERGLDSTIWNTKTHRCKLNDAKDYTLTKLNITGRMHFWGKGETGATEQNTLEVFVNGQRVVTEVDNNFEYWVYNPGKIFTVSSGPFDSDDVTLQLGFWDIADYELSLHAELTIGAQALLTWQTSVFNKVRAIEQQRVDKENQEMQLAYNSRMSEYRNRLAELKAAAVNELLQGQSEAFNREIIRTELKKHCLTLLTKEFDADESDDLLSTIDATQERPGDFTYRSFEVSENSSTTCTFEVKSETIDYPSIALEQARNKGRFIQFLEQAFEWHQLAYIFYPYFWAAQPDWISMMSRSDDADPNMTAFLQAGSVKVVLAVTPAYEEAVLHFLATREPWEGGPSPVIGDPLFIPLHEELRKQQDDLHNATPEGEPWTFTLPTSLIYLEDGGATLPTFPDAVTP
jgi:hypothetical protein